MKFTPSSRILWTYPVRIEQDELIFEIADFNRNGELVKQQADRVISNIKQQNDSLGKEITLFNNSLESEVRQMFETRVYISCPCHSDD